MSQELAKTLAQLKQLRESGVLDEAAYLAAVAGATQAAGVQATVSGPGAVAQAGGIAAGAGGLAAGQIHGPVSITNQAADPGATDPASLRRAYLSHLLGQVNLLTLAGVDPKAASEGQARLNLGAVYTALLTGTPDMEERLLAMADRERQPRRQTAVEQLDRHARLVLLGDPGSGKSTFVNFVALCLAGEALGRAEANLALLTAPLPPEEEERSGQEKPEAQPQPWRHGPLLPARVVLRDFAARGLPPAGQRATAKDLWRFMAGELERATLGDYAPLLRKELREQGGILLLDGLDEAPEAEQRRAQIRQAVRDFAAAFPRCRILVTSRTYAYQKQDWRLPGFSEAVLAPFSPGQIRRFVDGWYAHIAELRGIDRDNAQGRAELLKRAIFGSDRLLGLAERPLLLTLMASLHAWRGGSLPEKREELYNDAVDLLLDWWESQRIVRDAQGQVAVIQPSLAEWLQVDREQVRGLLNELAYQAHAGQANLVGTADVAEGELVSGLLRINQNPDVKLARLVEYLSQRAGLLVPRGVGVYTFPHRTFQEYLAACYLTDHDYPDQLAGLARDDPNRWREVALLAGAKAARGTASAIWSLVDALCWQDCAAATAGPADSWGALLAGQALVEGGQAAQASERNRVKVERVRGGLLHVLRGNDLPALERALAGRQLARLGDPRPEVLTVAAMQFCWVAGGPCWLGEGKQGQRYEGLAYDFWLARYPVSNAQFAEFVAAGGYERRDLWPEAAQAGYWRGDGAFEGRFESKPRRGPYDFGEPYNLSNHPVVGVTWYEALAFARWLNGWLQEQRRLPAGWQIALPSEAEWEKGARGGLGVPGRPQIAVMSSDLRPQTGLQANPLPQRAYPWGDEGDAQRANCREAKIDASSALGCFPGGASPYGCEELSGNVWEWTRSLYGDYPYPKAGKAREERENLAAGDMTGRVLRGGSYYGNRTDVRCSARFLVLP